VSGYPQIPELGQQAKLQEVEVARATQNNSPEELSRNPDYANSPKPLKKQASDVQPLRENTQ
jgi:hypothetical protein